MKSSFSIRESLRFGWDTTRANSAIVFQVVLTLLALQIAGSIIQKVLAHTLLGGLGSAVIFILNIFVSVGATVISLKLARGEEVAYREIIPDWRLTLRFMVAGIIAAIVVFAPLVLAGLVSIILLAATFGHIAGTAQEFVVHMHSIQFWVAACLVLVGLAATLYLAVRLSMVRFVILDSPAILQSMRVSRRMTQGIFWKLLGFLFIVAILNIIGFAALFVGVLLTLPVSLIAYAHIYDKLKPVELQG